MFVQSNQVFASRPFKRKGEFADDKQPWPTTCYKRPCATPAAQPLGGIWFGDLVTGADKHDVWVAKPGWANPRRVCVQATPMQRILRRSLSSEAQTLEPKVVSKLPEQTPMVQRNAPPRWGDFELQIGDDEKWWDEAEQTLHTEHIAEHVPMRRIALPRKKVAKDV